MRILIVEDDGKMALILREALERQMHRIVSVSTGTEGLEIARAYPFEAIVLDAMLHGMDGFRVAKHLREAQVTTPILMLTARDAVNDRVEGLDVGADDYLVKPFDLAELLARLRALLRRTSVADGRCRAAGRSVRRRRDNSARRSWLTSRL